LRILQVSNTYPPADISGVGTLVAELHAELRRAGHESWVVARVAPGEAGVVPVGGPKLLFPLVAAWRVWRLWRSGVAVDTVQVHESDGVLVVLLLRALRLLRGAKPSPRIFATLQVSYRRERLAVRAILDRGRVVSRPVPSERIFQWLRAPLLSLLGRLTARLADGVIAPSAATAQELREDYGVRFPTVIPNGVAEVPVPGPATPERARSEGEGVTVLFVGRLRTRKAVAVLVEAWCEVVAAAPSATLVLLGDGEQRARLAERVLALRLSESVRLAGAVPRGETERWLRSADVFCLPSTYEGFPLAILEAMACGLPVVATAVAGVPEAVADGRTGLLVPPEDAGALAAALLRLVRDPALRRRMGDEGRRLLGERFSIPRVVALYVAAWSGRITPPRR
jgi:glycosyltransferase involved in cell wall biosynthesis